ncbi:hypothetical protein ACHAPU_007201 [Fusarium lateritium]
MKHAKASLIVLAYTALASSAATPASPAAGAAAICGDLGILNLSPDEVPEGVKPWDLRLCADHPMGRNRTLDSDEGASLAPMEEAEGADSETTAAPSANVFEKKSCYYKSPYGCSRGWCWRSCGPKRGGQWCWVATQLGAGPWKTCNSWEDCSGSIVKAQCAKGCVISRSCGCGC